MTETTSSHTYFADVSRPEFEVASEALGELARMRKALRIARDELERILFDQPGERTHQALAAIDEAMRDAG